MNERQERIERLAERWFEGRTTDAEERELRELLGAADDVPESLRDLAMLFEGFEALAGEKMPRGEASDRMTPAPLGVPLASDLEPAGLPPEASGSASATAPAVSPAADSGASAELWVPSVRPVSRSGRRIRLFCGVAAAAVVAVGLFLGVELLRKPYCYIDGKPVYDKEVAMQTTVYFDSFAVLEVPELLVDELIQEP